MRVGMQDDVAVLARLTEPSAAVSRPADLAMRIGSRHGFQSHHHRHHSYWFFSYFTFGVAASRNAGTIESSQSARSTSVT